MIVIADSAPLNDLVMIGESELLSTLYGSVVIPTAVLVARKLADLRADPTVKARLEDLADKCTEGQLSSEELAEYETYVRAIEFIAVLQAKARRLLSNGYT
ncbi:MAG: hypothetical protein HYZ81_00285 [Nitrospinae bacterium]|nr:hypothetical protein [Nitrospinota bacterium]